MAAKNPLLTLRFPADPLRLRSVRQRVQSVAEKIGCNHKQVSELVVAVNEACMNIMQHAYKGDKAGEIVLEIRRDGGNVEVVLKDFAAPVDYPKIRPRALSDIRPGGLGTYFIQASVDECAYGHLENEGGNYVRMTKKIT
jgi:sigma-B regulation protein RsbU (phosphoserine phosphatase)